MKTVNRGPHFFLDHKIIHSARLINLTFLLLSNSRPPSLLYYPSREPPDPTFPTHSVQHMRKQNRISEHLQSSQTKTWQACTKQILEWAQLTPVYDENPLRRKLHWVLVEDVGILRRQGGSEGGFTKKMRQTAHSWLRDTIISKHYKFLLDLCVCVRITDLLLDHKNRG